MSLILIFDTETSGMLNKKLPLNAKEQPWPVEFGCLLYLSDTNEIVFELDTLIMADGRAIHPGAQAVHNITEDMCNAFGIPEFFVTNILTNLLYKADLCVCHNVAFDKSIMLISAIRQKNKILEESLTNAKFICTMETTTDLCAIPFASKKSWSKQNYKWPKLEELHEFLFGKKFFGAHRALTDAKACLLCYKELVARGFYV